MQRTRIPFTDCVSHTGYLELGKARVKQEEETDTRILYKKEARNMEEINVVIKRGKSLRPESQTRLTSDRDLNPEQG